MTWWWTNEVSNVIKEKRKLWKEWKNGGSKEAYHNAKKLAKRSVYQAKKNAEKSKIENLESKEGKNYIFKLAKHLKHENQDVISENCIRDDNGNLAFSDNDRLEAWKKHHERILNEEFPWDPNELTDEKPIAGPPMLITEDMVLQAIEAMKKGKAPGPSEVVIEMINASGPTMLSMLTKLMNSVIFQRKIPDDWNLSYIINCYKGKGDSLERGNYRGLKMLDQVLKLLERILEPIIRSQVKIDSMQFGFMPGKGAIDAIFILRQLQEKYISKKKDMFFIFVDLEKAFDRIPRKIIWWSMRKLGVEEWLVQVVRSMYENAKSKVHIGSKLSNEFEVKVGVHQGSVLSPLLFAIVMEAISREFRLSCPWEILYADDLVISADNIDTLIERFVIWKDGLASKGLNVNMKKTKGMFSKHDAALQSDKSRYPCGVCGSGVGRNSILCQTCNHWIHHKCTNLRVIREDPTFKCKKCSGEMIDNLENEPAEINIRSESIELVKSFCYLGDTINQSGNCFDATTARVNKAWGSFRVLLPVLTNKDISLRQRGYVYRSCVRSILLYASETWALKVEDLHRLERNENSMIRWICSVKLSDRNPTKELRQMLGICDIASQVQYNRLRWFGHLERMGDKWPNSIRSFEIVGEIPRGGQKKKWIHNINKDLADLNLSANLTVNRSEWRKRIKPQHDEVQPPNRGNQGR